MRKGIVEDMEHCYVCGTNQVEMHHCINGRGQRSIADQYNLVIPLCPEHHRNGSYSPHRNAEINSQYAKISQAYFEQNIGNREDFMKLFGRSWI